MKAFLVAIFATMALLDNMYAPYSHLMQRAFNGTGNTMEDPSITKLNSSNESSPPTVHHNRQSINTDNHPAKFGHYGGTVMTMNLKTFEKQTNFRPFSHPESPVARENNINEDNRKDAKVMNFSDLQLLKMKIRP